MSKTYVISDLHGYLPLWNKMCKELFKEDDIIYCLGDSGDRGPKPWETLKTILTDNRVIYIKGNHEDLLVNAAIDYFYYDSSLAWGTDSFELLGYNGGRNTYYGLMAEKEPLSWVKQIQKLPYFKSYTNKQGVVVYLTHAGFSPNKIPTEEEALWDRTHFITASKKETNQIAIIHGHTYQKKIAEIWEIPYVDDKPLWYDNGQKCCIDNQTVITKSAFALDLDTFESHYFKLAEDEIV